MREILEALAADTHDEVVLRKGVQTTGSTAARIALAHWADTSADATLIVYPDERSAKEEIADRVAPMFRASPRLRRHLTGRVYDVNSHEIRMRHTSIQIGWAGSPQALASRVFRRVVLDETDKYQRSPREAAPDDLARHRTTTYMHRRKIFALSTPTTRGGTISRMWESSTDRRHYWCPCPHCGELWRWEWAAVRWEGRDDADDMESLRAQHDELAAGVREAWIECSSCGGRTEEHQRMEVVRAGEWVSEGHAPGERPPSRKVAYHLHSLISPWRSFAAVAAAFLAGRMSDDMQDFYNNWLGLPADDDVVMAPASVYRERAAHKPGVAPDETVEVLAGADTQAAGLQPYWVYVVRAYWPAEGGQIASRLMDWGVAGSEQDLLDRTVYAEFPREGGGRVRVRATLVDAGGGTEVEGEDGNTTNIVYRLAKALPGRLLAARGRARSKDGSLYNIRPVDRGPSPGRERRDVALLMFDANRIADQMAANIARESPVLWQECQLVNAQYEREMTSVQKVKAKRNKPAEWQKRPGQRNDVWDANKMSFLLANVRRIGDREAFDAIRGADPELPERQRRARRARRERRGQQQEDWQIGRA